MKTKTDIVYGCDMYNFQITGDVAAGMNANSGLSANHAGPTLLILNDQGGSVMDTSEDVTSTLRAQDHGHPPVVCFEPGILRRDCSAGNRAYVDICSTLRAQMGDNQPAVCYEKPSSGNVYVMSERQISMMVTEDVSNTIAATDFKGSQVVCYEQCEMPKPVGSAEQTTVSD